ncbi:MAG: LptE family protein [Thermodesulfobacteriota bacterium]|nr:LptE family protein [Thermodesulfobacteriota bacterium]
MTKTIPGLLVIFCLIFLLGGCGYYFPHVYDGPEKSVYMPNWQNRTDKLGIDAVMYQSLSIWFQKSKAIRITKDKETADLILAGEITYIDLPSVAWDGNARATDVKVRLGLRYVLKDRQNNKILWEVPNDMWTEDFNTLNQSADSEDEALKQIIDDVSEKIYLGTLKKLREQNITQ